MAKMKYKSLQEAIKAGCEGARNKELENIMAGLYAYGRDETDRLVKEAVKQNKKLVFYYASDDDLLCDVLSYKFV